MPKRGGYRNFGGNGGGGGGGSRFSALKDYQEHDDRERGDRDRDNNKGRNMRRVTFKPSSNQHNVGGLGKGLKGMSIRAHLEDDDLMGDLATSSKYDRSHIPRRKGSPIPNGKFGSNKKLIQSSLGWYQVTVQSGHRYSREELSRTLLSAIKPELFIPHYWRVEKNAVVFYLDDFNTAVRMQQLDRSVQMSDGYRLFLRVRASIPIVAVDDDLKERMKHVMSGRYNAVTNALDLSKFHADPGFKDVFCGLLRAPVMSAALDIIEKNIPHLAALNLDNNFIASMEGFKDLHIRLPHLKILHLADNKIPSLAHLLVLRNVPLEELVLKGNPLRSRYKEPALYVSEVRRKFPKVTKLDGEELEPQIGFDVNESTAMPRAKASFLCDPAGTDIVRQFVEQYFLIFDSDNRQPLLDAYHESATMSITVPPASQAGRLNSFWVYNRNLRRFMNNDDAARLRLLKYGRLAVVSTLAELPKTKHDPQTFSVDLTLFTPKLISFTVCGLFKEFDSSSPGTSSSSDIRHFHRQFIIVPAGSGFCIRNELILITSATHLQSRKFLKASAPAAPPSLDSNGPMGSVQNRLQMNQPQPVAAAIAPAQAAPAQPSDATKMQMVQAMSTQSGMNMEWSQRCLCDTNWDFTHAMFVFEKLHKESKIPPEAFQK